MVTTTLESRAVAIATVVEMFRSGEARRIRIEAGVHQTDLARDVGVCNTAWSHWECGQVTPSGDRALAALALLRSLKAVTNGDSG
jgi:DNA-binding transcriptional regulator YiaG